MMENIPRQSRYLRMPAWFILALVASCAVNPGRLGSETGGGACGEHFSPASLWDRFSTPSASYASACGHCSATYGPHWLLVALAVTILLVGVVVWGALAGSSLPLILRRLGFDPAVSSAAFVATSVDVIGLVIYFSVACLMMQGPLL